MLMLRRRHKKSRNGCRECKQRHIKCDEKRPVCSHCSITGRDCHWVGRDTTLSAAPIAAPTNTAAATRSTDDSIGSIDRLQETSHLNTGPTPPRLNPWIISKPYGSAQASGNHASSPDSHTVRGTSTTPSAAAAAATAVNLHHIESMLHFNFTIAVPELDNDFASVVTETVKRHALEFPWLLHEVLAISSRHLAVLRPEASSLYLAQAFELQNEAINLFNAERLSIDETNCAAAVLFSSILGRHMLIDTLAALHSDGSVLLDSYCQYVQIHWGIRAVAADSWQLLPETEIWPFLLVSGIHRRRTPRGNELAYLRAWVEKEASVDGVNNALDQETLDVCLKAVDLLQVGLDDIRIAAAAEATKKKKTMTTLMTTTMTNTKSVRPYQMAFIWSVCNKEMFNDLVMQRLPQALVILAHYSVLLHHARHVWQVGDAGSRFLRTVCNALGPEYNSQLRWVRDIVFASGD
jgi:hypothetical protein